MSEPRDYLVWSYEHNQWWRADRCGYTSRLWEAGLYTRIEAKEIERDSTHGEIREECAVPLTEKADELLALRKTITTMLSVINL